ncbi:MAG: hypothetical protein Q9220_001541 [cf. Caloplaca sp. 1 TL-2023]
MGSPVEKASRPLSRKSIAHMPSLEGMSKENVTLDSAGLAQAVKAIGKKSRSKSLGPGGLEALREGTGNRREAAETALVKSILKPSISLSPPKQIPPRSNVRHQVASPRKQSQQGTPEKRKSSIQEGFLIDTSDFTHGVAAQNVGLPSRSASMSPQRKNATSTTISSQSQSLVPVRTEEEQHAAAREREEQEKGTAARKDARPNRRVSFAPEATLHTWNVIELPEDSTTSSASGNSTRRASGLSAMATSPSIPPQSPLPSSDPTEPPSTPPAQAETPQPKVSPAHQRDLHQKKRRRSSGIPPMNFNNPEEFSSSPCSGSSVASDDTGNQAFLTADEGDSSDSDDKDLVEDESTVTGIDNDDVTAQSALSARSSGGSSTGSSDRLDEVLRQAARQAGTQGIEYDEHGDISMEMADDEITNAFQPWAKNGKNIPQSVGNPSALQDQENVNPFSPEFRLGAQAQARNNEGGETMDITQAVGSILPDRVNNQISADKSRRKSGISAGRRRSSVGRRRSSGASSAYGDETMDLTMAIGGIKDDRVDIKSPQTANSELPGSDDEDEELTMELTTVLGGVLGQKAINQHDTKQNERRMSADSSAIDEDMDTTFAAGGILSSITERTEPAEDQTVEMDVTQAMGAILPRSLTDNDINRSKILMEREADAGQLPLDPFYDGPTDNISGAVILKSISTRASESGSPTKRSMTPQASIHSVVAQKLSLTPVNGSRQTTPLKKTSTPSKQVTPQVGPRPTTPGKTPPSKNVSLRTGSPKKLFSKEISHAAASSRTDTRDLRLKSNDEHGFPAAQIVLKPRRRRSSGLGIDKEGLGSPRVTEILDRRSSISQCAQSFIPQIQKSAGVRFEDPRAMEIEVDKERAEEERRESGRGILQLEADVDVTGGTRDATTSLKGKIESLTPQKKPKSRKSLHVGAARGILGKRPAELDADDDEDTTPQRLGGREGSPVKKIKLPAPPSKSETTRRNMKSSRASLVETSGNLKINTPSIGVSPSKEGLNTTPEGQLRFKDASENNNTETPMPSFQEKLEAEHAVVAEPTETEDRIHLQDFLDMTSIRFMELTTTKRRLTVAPDALNNVADGSTESNDFKADHGLERSVVAGACTVPMLELYQHSCRELKRYIAEGRSIVREIEADTYDDNPALFREYITAAPDMKALMDNQFKNVKTHARLLSKAMWYEWRMKLLEGLKEGLVQISHGMDDDAAILSQQEHILDSVLPRLAEENNRLQDEHDVVQSQAEELASCDQDELREARETLAALDKYLQGKQRLADELNQDVRDKEQNIQDAIERRDEFLAEIKEAERVRQESRGWKASEVAALQERVTELEETCGWKITSAAGSTITMTYKDSLQLFFTPASFIGSGTSPSAALHSENSPISLTYIADSHLHHPRPLTTEKRFFLQIIRAQLQCLPQSQTLTSDLLSFISSNWEAALAIAEEVRSLNTQYITDATILSDEVMAVKAVMLLTRMQTKLEITFQVQARGDDEGALGLDLAVKSVVRVVYGEGLKEGKMAEWVDGRLKEEDGEKGAWARCVGRLEERLKGRGRK